MKVLHCGNCEELKLGVHAMVLGLAGICGLYNAAAWLSRREQHLAVNTLLYAALIALEQRHVVHHMAELRRLPAALAVDVDDAAPDVRQVQPPAIAA
jgi:hypothetical protein